MEAIENKPQRFNERVYLSDLKPSKIRIIFSDLINTFLFLGIMVGLFWWWGDVDFINRGQAIGILFLGVIVYFIVVHVLFLIFGWRSFGNFVTQTAFVNGIFGRKLDGWDIIGLGFKRIGYRFKYQQVYDIFYFFTSPYNQTVVLHKNYVFIVDNIKYKRLINNGDLLI